MLAELPYFFKKASEKIATRSPEPINREQALRDGREGKGTVNRAFYLSTQQRAYDMAGFAFIILTVITALVLREAGQIPVLLFWGLSLGFFAVSMRIQGKLVKFQLLFAHEPTQEQLDEALRKAPSNWLWIITAAVAAIIPVLFFMVLL